MIEKHDIYIHGKAIPIGNTYRELFFARLAGKDKDSKLFPDHS